MEIRKKIAEALMNFHGYDREDPSQSSDWQEEPPSAYAMMLEDADIALNTIMEADEPKALLGVVTPSSEDFSAVHKSAALFIFLDTPEGTPTYVKDVRAWLDAVDKAGVSDDTEIDGFLHLTYDFTFEDINKNTTTLTLYNHKPL